MTRASIATRLEALERRVERRSAAVWMFRGPDESNEEAIARWEADNGPLDGRWALIWIETGVPRDRGLVCG